MPAYLLPDFVAACGVKRYAMVSRQAQEDAASDFRLLTQDRVLEFIANGGLEQPRHANTAPWNNNRDPSVRIDVDSYDFYSGCTFGYIAFVHSPTTNMWIIKSFKKNDKPSQRSLLGNTLPIALIGSRKQGT
jgi:hypothetical protein